MAVATRPTSGAGSAVIGAVPAVEEPTRSPAWPGAVTRVVEKISVETVERVEAAESAEETLGNMYP